MVCAACTVAAAGCLIGLRQIVVGVVDSLQSVRIKLLYINVCWPCLGLVKLSLQPHIVACSSTVRALCLVLGLGGLLINSLCAVNPNNTLLQQVTCTAVMLRRMVERHAYFASHVACKPPAGHAHLLPACPQ